MDSRVLVVDNQGKLAVVVGRVHLRAAGMLGDLYMEWEQHDIADYMVHTVDSTHMTGTVDLAYTVQVPVGERVQTHEGQDHKAAVLD
jgi:hypothetical protein